MDNLEHLNKSEMDKSLRTTKEIIFLTLLSILFIFVLAKSLNVQPNSRGLQSRDTLTLQENLGILNSPQIDTLQNSPAIGL